MTTRKRISKKNIEIDLYLSPAVAKYLQGNLCDGTTDDAIQLKKGLILSSMIELCIEERSLGWKSATFSGSQHLSLQLSDMKWIRPGLDTRVNHYWIPPHKMEYLDQVITKIMRSEMVSLVFGYSGKHERKKQVEAIREFMEKYHITEAEFSEENAIKVYQRATDYGKTLNVSLL